MVCQMDRDLRVAEVPIHIKGISLPSGTELSPLYYRNFYGVIPDCVELAQEFILLNNLYYDSIKHSYFELCMDGETEEAVRYQNDNCTVSVKLKYLQKYAAAKQMAILLFFDISGEKSRGL